MTGMTIARSLPTPRDSLRRVWRRGPRKRPCRLIRLGYVSEQCVAALPVGAK
jgi:hypothetical protein